MGRRAIAAIPMLLGWVVVCLAPSSGFASTAPTIRLFPTTVLEDIKETGNAAQQMETGLQEVIRRLDQQQELFRESKCEGAARDPGCETITQQLGETYLEMLDTMSEKLPAMERSVNNTLSSLERRLRGELGKKMTPWQLQEMLAGQTSTPTTAERPTLRGRSGMRLSDRFQQYYRLVAQTGNDANSSLAVIAADIYLDMQEASVLISRTQEEISRATLMEQLNQSFGAVTPEMQEIVAGVKTILFGETELVAPVASPPPGNTPQEYLSPLQL